MLDTTFELPMLPANLGTTPAAAAYTTSMTRAVAPRGPGAVIKRDKFIGFARDEASAKELREALAGYVPNSNQVHVVDFRNAITILAAMTTPEIVLVDLAGEDQPLNAIMELAEVVEQGTVVLTIGDNQNLNFYRTITKGLGIKDYLPKPLTRAAIEQHFLPTIANMAGDHAALRGGRSLAIAGTRGGVGTSTIAANLAWYLSHELHRHTLLLDGELSTGTVALKLDISPTHSLATALESPERLDQLLIERSIKQVGERLHALAGLEDFETTTHFTSEGAVNFLQAVRARYNYVVADAGSRLQPLSRELLFNAQQRVIVMDPSTISIRNLGRLMTLPGGTGQSTRIFLVLNHAGAPGGLTQSYMEQAMGLRFDAVIPDLPRVVPHATQTGTQAATMRGPFRTGIAALANTIGTSTLTIAA